MQSDTDKPESLRGPVNHLLSHIIIFKLINEFLQESLAETGGNTKQAMEGIYAVIVSQAKELAENQDPTKRKMIIAALVNLIVVHGLLDMTAMAYVFDPRDET